MYYVIAFMGVLLIAYAIFSHIKTMKRLPIEPIYKCIVNSDIRIGKFVHSIKPINFDNSIDISYQEQAEG